MRHLTLEQQLQLQDGEELPDAAEHLASCAECADEQQRLKERRARLRALPMRRPRADGWLALRSAVIRSRQRRRVATVGLALAAGLVVLVLIPSLVRRPAVSRIEMARTENAPSEIPAPSKPSPELAALINQSKALDQKLEHLPNLQVIDVSTANSIVELEDQIALIDQFINSLNQEGADVEEISALWRTRIELLETLIAERTPPLTVVL
jgi:hypothetical protein